MRHVTSDLEVSSFFFRRPRVFIVFVWKQSAMSLLLFLALAAFPAVIAFAPSAVQLSGNRLAGLSANPLFSLPTSLRVTVTPNEQTSSKKVQIAANDRLYVPEQKELPKVAGGLKIGTRQIVCITGASSGLGLNCAISLAKSGNYFVIMAVRDVEKAKRGMF
jgi:hypothetical protein